MLRGSRTCLLLLFLLAGFWMQTVSAFASASEGQTMYLKNQSFSYYIRNTSYEYINGVFGKGEMITVLGTRTVKDGNTGRKQTFCRVRILGQDAYLPAECLTSKKPVYTCRVILRFRKLVLAKPAVLYETPSRKAEKRGYEADGVYTIGETRGWFRVFVDGRVWFLPKNEKAIACTEESADSEAAGYPEIQICGMKPQKKQNMMLRIQYAFGMLPYPVQKLLTEEQVTVKAGSSLPDPEYEAAGAGGYARYSRSGTENTLKEVCVKEGELPYRIEASLLHEFGHMTGYLLFQGDYAGRIPEEWRKEAEALGLRSRYRKEREYFAECFELYVKDPELVRRKAAKTADCFFDLLN